MPCLSTCSKLCVSHQLAMERAGTTLPKETILRICLKVAKLVVGGILRPGRLTRAARPGHRPHRHGVCRTGRTANENPNYYASPTKGEAMTLQYDPTSKKYLLDARTTTKAKALSALGPKD